MACRTPIPSLSLPWQMNTSLNFLFLPLMLRHTNGSQFSHVPMLVTQLDLAYTVAVLSRHTTTPRPDHQHALKCIFCYLQATANHQLILGHSATSVSTLLSYTNSD